MLFIIGAVVVVASVIGGYIANGGHLEVLFQPFEWLIIGGAAIGAFVISNRKPVLSHTLGAITGLIKGERYDKDAYLELLSLLYTIFKLAKSKGALALEPHCEAPDQSELFQRFPAFHSSGIPPLTPFAISSSTVQALIASGRRPAVMNFHISDCGSANRR